MTLQFIKTIRKKINKKSHNWMKYIKFHLNSTFSKEYSNLKKREYPHNDKYFPLTKMQEAFYWSQKIKPLSKSYVVNQQMHYDVDFDLNKFEECIRILIDRHEILRTTFHEVNGMPMQRVENPFSYKVLYYDQRDQPLIESEINYRKLSEEPQKELDITKLPLFQISVFRIGNTDYRIGINVHHLIGDGTSTQLMLYELSQLYNNKPLPRLDIQYADYALFEKENAKPLTDEDVEHWKSYFSHYEPISLNGMKKKLGELKSNQSTLFRFLIPKATSKNLHGLKEQLDTSLFMIFLSSFFILLSRHSDSSKISVGFSKSIRGTNQLIRSLGLYLNTLVFRHDMNDDITFTELVREFEKNRNDLYKRSHNSFVDVVKKLKPNHHKNRNNFFDILFNFLEVGGSHNIHFGNAAPVGIDMTYIESEFLLTMYAVNYIKDRQIILVKYFPEIFDLKTIQTLCFQYEHILNQVSANPNKKLSEYSLVYPNDIENDYLPFHSTLSPAYQFEHATINPKIIPDLSEKIDKTDLKTVPELILDQYQANPLHKAIIKGEQSWSYSDLVETANAIAEQLRQKYLKKGATVAIHGERSFGLYASLLGTWLAGGVILIVDPNNPAEFKNRMISESDCQFMIRIHSPQEASFTPEISNEFQLSIQEDEVLNTNSPPTITAALEDPAYIVFTSGTTNEPKGILGTHEGLSHFVSWQKEQFGIGPNDRCVQITSLSFDVALREIFTPLISGGTLCIPLASERIESGHFLEYLDYAGITMMHIVPTLMDFLIEHSQAFPEKLSLRWVFSAGEPLHDHLAHKWRKKFPHNGKLVNLYGPSETTLAKAFYELPDQLISGIQPIGRPLPQTLFFVLNSTGAQCGVGELGEICIYTPYKTRGYLNLPLEQTRFAKHPAIEDPDASIYHSGDLGFYDADGNIHIAGRLDDQFKIHGVRINPHHIASSISKNFPVKQCVVTAIENERNERKLVVYLVPNNPSQTLGMKQQIIAFLRSHYSSYYVPSAIMMVDSIPYTARGKVDKKALPPPTFEEDKDHIELPSSEFNEIQLNLKEFCEKVLHIKVENNQTNLFENGLDSLGSLQLIIHINQTYNANLDFHELREMDSLSKISNRLASSTTHNENKSSKGTSIEQLQQHVLLPNSFLTSTSTNAIPSQKIFITGATGFLGSYLLYELIQQHPDSDIYCLIRAKDNKEAIQKISNTLNKYQHPIDDLEHHIIPVLGDLSKPLLGLLPKEFNLLSKEIDLIYHCGATVHFASNFDQLSTINVEGTKTILELAYLNKIKALHYISTAGIYPITSETATSIIHDDEPFDPNAILNTGYAQTKWIADQLVAQARQYSIPVTIYRPGEISGDTQTGLWKEDLIFRFIKGCLQMKALPDLPITIDLTPVDLLAKTIIEISFNPEMANKNFNIVNPHQISINELESCMKNLELDIGIIPYPEWRERLMNSLKLGQQNPLLTMMEFFPPSYEDFPRLKFNRTFSNQNILNAVKNSKDIFPQPYPELLNLYVRTLGLGSSAP